MAAKVAVVDISEDVGTAFEKALHLIGDIDDINTKERPVTIKVGVFHHKKGHHHTTVEVAQAIANRFDKAPTIYVAESDNYKGRGLERLQIYQEIFSDHVVPFNLSEDTETKEFAIADELIELSHILFEPHVFVSTHVLRKAQIGSILKNLLGLIPDRKKARFHKKLVPTLLDAYEAIGRIDLAVLDGTYAYVDPTNDDDPGTKADMLIVGRDAVAVEAVGVNFCALNPEKIPVIQEAVKRGLGEGDIKNIIIVGDPLEIFTERILQ
ncbi:MAG: DUF362 domain-containing protein [Theionarchaea archaeon]|nr:DUF362 domain-containing protein [Theionarchaea archaeon]